MEKIVFPIRINKYLALKKYSTRKGADELIKKGLVLVNGRRAVLGASIIERDEVTVLGQKQQKPYRYFAYNKPRGIITHSPQEGEKDIEQTIPLSGVYPIGRLDKKSHGLMILTDDGRITDRLLNPKNAHTRTYQVETKENLSPSFKEKMEKGVLIEGYRTKKCNVAVEGERAFKITLTEGKKHQIRRMCAALGYTVLDLKRTDIMNVAIGNLKAGEHRVIDGEELRTFLSQLDL